MTCIEPDRDVYAAVPRRLTRYLGAHGLGSEHDAIK
jgi:hypothetical protein